MIGRRRGMCRRRRGRQWTQRAVMANRPAGRMGRGRAHGALAASSTTPFRRLTSPADRSTGPYSRRRIERYVTHFARYLLTLTSGGCALVVQQKRASLRTARAANPECSAPSSDSTAYPIRRTLSDVSRIRVMGPVIKILKGRGWSGAQRSALPPLVLRCIDAPCDVRVTRSRH